jgi:hypothetical protein
VGLWGEEVELENGQMVVADMDYVRRSILDPHAELVAGYGPVMPTYDGEIDEAQLLTLIEYIRSLGDGEASPGALQADPNSTDESAPSDNAPGDNSAWDNATGETEEEQE